MATSSSQPATDQQNPPSVVGTLYGEHERTARFQENVAKRPRDCDPAASFETKWAFTVAESKRADVEKKTSNQLTSATMTISFALREVKEEITEIDSLLRGINTREHELESMTNSLDKMCLTLAARSIDRKKAAAEPNLLSAGERPAITDTGPPQSEQQDVDMKTATAATEDTITSPTSNVSTADEIDASAVEHPTLPSMMTTASPGTMVPEQLGRISAAECNSHYFGHPVSPGRPPMAPETPARSPTGFDYSALSAYTPAHDAGRTPHKLDSTFTCPRTAPKSRSSSSRSRSERRA